MVIMPIRIDFLPLPMEWLLAVVAVVRLMLLMLKGLFVLDIIS
jgi:hypothetical protein